MSIDTYAHIQENPDGTFSLLYGTQSDDRVTLICTKPTLKEAILESGNLELEYGLSFSFLDDKKIGDD